MIENKYLIIIAIVSITVVILLYFITIETYSSHRKKGLYLPDQKRHHQYTDKTCYYLHKVFKQAGYQDKIFLENDIEEHYDKGCSLYKDLTSTYPNYNNEVCEQVNLLIKGTAGYDLGNEIDLHDDLEEYYNKNCKIALKS